MTGRQAAQLASPPRLVTNATTRNDLAGEFPAPVQLGPRSVGWWLDEIEALAGKPPTGEAGRRREMATVPAAREPAQGQGDQMKKLSTVTVFNKNRTNAEHQATRI
jgi:hypothetical protein